MENIDSKKEIEKKLSEALQSMYIKDLFNEEFINTYMKDNEINKKFKNLYLKDITLQKMDENSKNTINELLSSSENTSNIKDFDILVNKATEYAIIKRMKNLNIL